MVCDDSTLQYGLEGRLIRGGTSKGFFSRRDAFPDDPDRRDEIILELFGTPDSLQVDGLGGSHTHTSKLMLIDDSNRPDVDLSYEYAQVGIENPTVDWSGNCGNLLSAVGVFGLLESIIQPDEPKTTVRIYSKNTNSIIEQDIPIENGEPTPYGSYRIDGVPGAGARIQSRYLEPGGGMLGDTLPTGNTIDELEVGENSYKVSIVDATNVTVFLRADALNCTGTELPAELNATEGLLTELEQIRGAACVELGLVDNAADAIDQRPTMPFVALITKPQAYETTVGSSVARDEIDVTARMVSTQQPHHAYATTGAMCLAAATRIHGTIPAEAARGTGDAVRIGHPKGTMTIGVDADSVTEQIRHVSIGRTARQLMSGKAFYRDLDRLK
ncbi:protein FldA [Natronolimnobius sp. AArcel1]|uniref:PrpF domain-containing protein n=1 Tax=Natronolimnobius sp. AArcel1 TaxID=1679093 RepID=UPI0013EDAE86|nr:PrpF domain-containing protein [Natronolimnobius sp. AArcel1]NGM71316.1 protein FldA [Natronolimnobius sp. AArcel1]